MLVNDTNRAKAAAILAAAEAEALAEYGWTVMLTPGEVDETIRVTRPGHLPRMLQLAFGRRMNESRAALIAAARKEG